MGWTVTIKGRTFVARTRSEYEMMKVTTKCQSLGSRGRSRCKSEATERMVKFSGEMNLCERHANEMREFGKLIINGRNAGEVIGLRFEAI